MLRSLFLNNFLSISDINFNRQYTTYSYIIESTYSVSVCMSFREVLLLTSVSQL